MPDVITFIIVSFLLIGVYLAGCTIVVEILDWLDRRDLATYDERVLVASTPSDTDNNESQENPS
jgi:hypothetical protein